MAQLADFVCHGCAAALSSIVNYQHSCKANIHRHLKKEVQSLKKFRNSNPFLNRSHTLRKTFILQEANKAKSAPLLLLLHPMGRILNTNSSTYLTEMPTVFVCRLFAFVCGWSTLRAIIMLKIFPAFMINDACDITKWNFCNFACCW